jgi:hypothetical protein
MLTPIVPWTSIGPIDFINAASTGARLGLERAQMATSANEAAQRLQQGYAQLASENARAAAAQAGENTRANAANALRFADFQAGLAEAARRHADQATAAERLNNYRVGELGIRQQHEDNAAYGNKLRRYMHVGNSVVDLSGETPTVAFSGPTQPNAYDIAQYRAALQRVHAARSALAQAPSNSKLRPALQKELDDAMAAVEEMDKKRAGGTSAADALGTAWSPTGGEFIPSGSFINGIAPPVETPSDDGSFSVGKYRVTPLGGTTNAPDDEEE